MNIGDVYGTNYWGDVEVVELLGGRNIVVRFINTGNLKNIRSSDLKVGLVRDTKASEARVLPTTPYRSPSRWASFIEAGTLFPSNHYGMMKVISYRGNKDIQIKFVDTGNELSIQKYALDTGQVHDVVLRSQRIAQKAEDEVAAKAARDLASEKDREERYHMTKAGKAQAKRDKASALAKQRVSVRDGWVKGMIGSVHQNKLGDIFTVVAPTSGLKTWVVEFDGTGNRYKCKEGLIISGGVHDHDSNGYAERQKTHHAAMNAVRYEANREVRIAQASAYQRDNVERTRERNRRNLRKRLVAEGSHTNEEKLRLIKEQDNKCNCCGYDLSDGKHIDHIMPISLGGSDYIENVQWLCQVCNSVKADRHPDEWSVYSASDEYRARLSGRRKM